MLGIAIPTMHREGPFFIKTETRTRIETETRTKTETETGTDKMGKMGNIVI